MKRLVKWGLVAGLLVLSAITGTALWFDAQDGPLPPADAILVLGAGMEPDGTLHASTMHRVDKGVALYQAGAARYLVMTGGRLHPDAPSAGEQMAAMAEAQGVPREALIFEGASLSTLQNALMTRPLLDRAGIRDVILVTEGFHMARALATMRWAGIKVVAARTSTAFRDGGYAATRMVLREAAAWGLNLARVPVWHIGGWLGVDDPTRMDWLQ